MRIASSSKRYKQMLVINVVIKSAVFRFKHAHNSSELFTAVELIDSVLVFLKLFGSKVQRLIVVEHSGIEYLSLDKILEDVAAVRKLGVISRLAFLHFAHNVKAADI